MVHCEHRPAAEIKTPQCRQNCLLYPTRGARPRGSPRRACARRPPPASPSSRPPAARCAASQGGRPPRAAAGAESLEPGVGEPSACGELRLARRRRPICADLAAVLRASSAGGAARRGSASYTTRRRVVCRGAARAPLPPCQCQPRRRPPASATRAGGCATQRACAPAARAEGQRLAVTAAAAAAAVPMPAAGWMRQPKRGACADASGTHRAAGRMRRRSVLPHPSSGRSPLGGVRAHSPVSLSLSPTPPPVSHTAHSAARRRRTLQPALPFSSRPGGLPQNTHFRWRRRVRVCAYRLLGVTARWMRRAPPR